MNNKKDYTICLIFSPYMKTVYLIRKNRPAWQAGKLNGIGGKVEKGETFIDCCVREVKEECGVPLSLSRLVPLARMDFNDATVAVFYYVLTGNEDYPITLTDESVIAVSVKDVSYSNVTNFIPNITWLVPMALCHRFGMYNFFAGVEHGDAK